MCNLYSITKGQQAIRDMYRAATDTAGNLPPLPGVFPDQMAPVVCNGGEGRVLAMMRWGFPPRAGVAPGRGVTNVRNTGSAYWRAWMGVEYRCLVPATGFCEYAAGKPAVSHWFALDEGRPMFAFAGLWRTWWGTRGTKAAPVEGEHRVFAFLTCAPNREVGAVHPKAMPVLLTTAAACDAWLEAPVEEALRLQRPLADGALRVVARGAKQDPPGEEVQGGLLL